MRHAPAFDGSVSAEAQVDYDRGVVWASPTDGTADPEEVDVPAHHQQRVHSRHA
jgi:hypothetical protein